MVYGVEDEIYFGLYTAWGDSADDERYGDWARSNMAAMSHLATGISLADENLAQRPATFITESNMARLDQSPGHLRPGWNVPQLAGAVARRRRCRATREEEQRHTAKILPCKHCQSERCSSTLPLSAETTCTWTIWSTGVDVLPPSFAVWPGSATQVAS